MGNMFQLYLDFATDFRKPRSVDSTRGLHPKLQSFDSWLQANKAKIPLG
jgi:uncharacterized protein (DUF1501 family)